MSSRSPRIPTGLFNVVPTEGDSAVRFDDLVREQYVRLCNFAIRFVRERDAAEDIVQDVLANVWRRHERFNYDDPLPYLYQAVRNQAATRARRDRVRDQWFQRAVHAPEPIVDNAAAASELSELAQAIAHALQALPERRRLIFTMSREQNLTYAEIAHVLGISIKTVETQMGRALMTLRSKLKPYLPALALLIYR